MADLGPYWTMVFIVEVLTSTSCIIRELFEIQHQSIYLRQEVRFLVFEARLVQ